MESENKDYLTDDPTTDDFVPRQGESEGHKLVVMPEDELNQKLKLAEVRATGAAIDQMKQIQDLAVKALPGAQAQAIAQAHAQTAHTLLARQPELKGFQDLLNVEYQEMLNDPRYDLSKDLDGVQILSECVRRVREGVPRGLEALKTVDQRMQKFDEQPGFKPETARDYVGTIEAHRERLRHSRYGSDGIVIMRE